MPNGNKGQSALRPAEAPAMNWGPRLEPDGGASFRLWAPQCGTLALRTGGQDLPMTARPGGWFEARAEVAPGADYAFVLPDGRAVPDPAARAQAGDVLGPSRLVDPANYGWRNRWGGADWSGAVICEIHVGTFTEAGTFAAAQERLAHLAGTGITAVEIMPVAQFAGRRGWGYDGVLPYAPHPAYGTPTR